MPCRRRSLGPAWGTLVIGKHLITTCAARLTAPFKQLMFRGMDAKLIRELGALIVGQHNSPFQLEQDG